MCAQGILANFLLTCRSLARSYEIIVVRGVFFGEGVGGGWWDESLVPACLPLLGWLGSRAKYRTLKGEGGGFDRLAA